MEGALLLVAVLACPVGMGLMMWFMGRGMKQNNSTSAQPKSVEQLREEHRRLEAQIATREADEAPVGDSR